MEVYYYLKESAEEKLEACCECEENVFLLNFEKLWMCLVVLLYENSPMFDDVIGCQKLFYVPDKLLLTVYISKQSTWIFWIVGFFPANQSFLKAF